MEKQGGVMEEAIRLYNLFGLSCLPVSKDKSPYNVSTWKGGITDPSAYSGAYGIGIICGSASGGVECIDFDNHFGDAKDVISMFVKTPEVDEIYRKYKFPIESTMNGGYHFVYRCSAVGGNQKLARRPVWREERNRHEADVLIETRGEGGYFAAAPTPGYILVRNSFETIPTITPDERGVLLSVCRSFNTWIDKDARMNDEEKEKPGDIYNSKHEAIDDSIRCLKGAGWVEVRPGIWRRPGKKEGISATFGKVAPGVFYNFSSSAYPFDPDHAYRPFQIVGLLKHNGDFKTFARELAEKYTDIVRDTRPEPKKPQEEMTVSEMDAIISKTYINTDIPIAKPPVILQINDNGEWQRLFTLGNFSALTGKGKSKKTFLNTMLLAAAASGRQIQNKFAGELPDNKQAVLLFDTEQSRYDAWLTSKRTITLAGYDIPNFGSFALREYSPLQRCDIIEYALKKYGNTVGLIAIDGIADLAKAINDEEEATRVGSWLMRLSSEYNIHIITVIHQNKGDNFATGHLGSMIIKKAEAVIGVERDASERNRSKVSCDNMRGVADFEDFFFEIEDHIPRICNGFMPSKKIAF
jgi:hypothetical protein